MARVLVDANVVTRYAFPPDPQHEVIFRAVGHLLSLGVEVGFTPQAVRETYHVYTRPTNGNGFGLDQPDALARLAELDSSPLVFLDDTPAVYREWRAILARTHVLGIQAYDAYHAASALAHGAAAFVTLDRKDFARYAGVRVVRPAEIVAPGFGLG